MISMYVYFDYDLFYLTPRALVFFNNYKVTLFTIPASLFKSLYSSLYYNQSGLYFTSILYVICLHVSLAFNLYN